MAQIMRVKVRWSGFVGGPGYSIYHFKDFEGGGSTPPTTAMATAAVAKLNDFSLALIGLVGRNVTMGVQNDVEVIEETTGEMVNILNATGGGNYLSNASAGQVMAGASGACINWRTGVVRKGRRIKGRTFLVPLKTTVYDEDGTLTSAAIGTIQTAATALINTSGAADLGVYARPTRQEGDNGQQETIPDGLWAVATSFNIPDKAAVLRSRRD
jgi:hypothetical protein